jgi:hypothetical protein
MAQRIPERRLPLLIAAAAQFGKQVRRKPLAEGGDKQKRALESSRPLRLR